MEGRSPPAPAGCTPADTNRGAVGLLGHLGTLLAHVQPAVSQNSLRLFLCAAFQPLYSKPVAMLGAFVTKVQKMELGLVEIHTIGLSPLIQPVQIPLKGLPTSKQIDTSCQLCVICKLTEGCETHPWGTPLVTGHQLDVTPFTTALWARPSSQFFTQQRVYLSKLQAASFCRRIPWETVSKALKCISHSHRN